MTNVALVTGAGGFIGAHLVEHLLKSEQKVIAVDIHLDAVRHLQGRPGLRLVELDIRATSEMAELISEADTIYHLAAAHLDVLKDNDYYHAVNVDAVREMIGAAAAAGVTRFVHCSSVGVYGSLETVPADEETACHPDIAYERTKLAGEQAVLDAVAATDISAIILRPSWVYGPGCPRTMKLIRTIANRRFFFAGNGENLRHPVFISDLLDAFDRASVSDVPSGEVLIIGGPEAVTTRELVSAISELTGTRARPPTFPFWFVTAGCYAVEGAFKVIGKPPPFSSRSLKFFSENSAFSIDKARRLLGFEPKTSLNKGLEATIQYGREHQLI
jgi:nucleoside-diphosphate-sugar epimerase